MNIENCTISLLLSRLSAGSCGFVLETILCAHGVALAVLRGGFQCAIMVTHNAIILNVYDPIMNGIHNHIMDIHMQLWIWYPHAILDIYTFQELQLSLMN